MAQPQGQVFSIPPISELLLGAMVLQTERVWDYVALRNTLIDAGVSAAAWQEFEESCIRPAFADGCLARYTNAQRE